MFRKINAVICILISITVLTACVRITPNIEETIVMEKIEVSNMDEQLRAETDTETISGDGTIEESVQSTTCATENLSDVSIVDTKDIKSYVDVYSKAFDGLLQGDTFHIRVKNHCGNDPMAADKYNITEVWKAGQDYFQHSVTYYLDDTFCWDWGDLLRNGAGYKLTFGSIEADAYPETVESVQYLEPFNFTLHLSEFDYFKTGVDSVTVDGDRVILIKDEEYVNDVRFDVRKVEVQYNSSGSIGKLFFVNEESDLTIEVEVLEDTPEEIRSWINSIDVVSPRSFSYAKEMEALAQLSYEKIESGFQNTSSVTNISRETVLELAKAECTRSDYNVYSISYDQDSKMWKVEFGISWDSYYYEVIYINNNGLTQLVATRPYPEVGEDLLPTPSEYT